MTPTGAGSRARKRAIQASRPRRGRRPRAARGEGGAAHEVWSALSEADDVVLEVHREDGCTTWVDAWFGDAHSNSQVRKPSLPLSSMSSSNTASTLLSSANGPTAFSKVIAPRYVRPCGVPSVYVPPVIPR
jgi:hypothetical protein